MHKLLNTSNHVADILAPALKETKYKKVVDLCSGSGGPMLEAIKILEDKYGLEDLSLTLTDLYPNQELVRNFNSKNGNVSYEPLNVDVSHILPELDGFRTIISGFHHMPPKTAKRILESAKQDKRPILIFEMSDNSAPILLSFIALPINFLMALFVTPAVRPLTCQQLLFTYLIPIIPLTFAWDGAVSNMRTYTLSDLDELLEGLYSEDYTWKKERINGRAKQLYLLGIPKT